VSILDAQRSFSPTRSASRRRRPVRSLVAQSEANGFHGHNTRNTGYANALAEGEGFETGVDLDALVAISVWLEELLGRRLEGYVYRAG
jgi:isopropylmalate/homocitrate/citramalate synthase